MASSETDLAEIEYLLSQVVSFANLASESRDVEIILLRVGQLRWRANDALKLIRDGHR